MYTVLHTKIPNRLSLWLFSCTVHAHIHTFIHVQVRTHMCNITYKNLAVYRLGRSVVRSRMAHVILRRLLP